MLATEAWRNVASRTTRAGLFGGVWFVLVLSTLSWNAAVVVDVVHAAQRYQASGAATFVVEADSGIDGNRCEAATATPHVLAAGALRVAPSPLEPAATPGVELPTYEVTPGLLGVLYEDDSAREGVFLSSQVSMALGVAPSEELATVQSAIAVAGVFPFPDDGRRAGLGYSALATVDPAQAFDQCWVRVWPESDRARALVSASVVEGLADQGVPTVSQLNTTLGAAFDGEARYRTRASSLAPLALMVAGGAIGTISIRLRRLELAAARLVGVRTLDQTLHLGLETAAWSAAGSFGALAASTVFAAWAGGGLEWSIFEYSVVGIVAGSAGVLGGALIGIASIDSRRALGYFKSR